MTTAATATPTSESRDRKKPRDPAREVVETVVFVVVLVLLLKLFVTEAFVIPTGSMAETLYGYQKIVTCPKCGCEFPVNSHDEVEGAPGPGGGPRVTQPVVKYICPNCRFHGDIGNLSKRPENRSGDRVLVLKPLYHLREPHRGDVVVFKFPRNPQENHIAANYIKRAMGFGGETIAIFRGDLFVTQSLEYPEGADFPRPDNPLDVWQQQYMYNNSGHAETLFEASRQAGFPPGPIKDFPAAQYNLVKPLIESHLIDPTRPGFTMIRKNEGQVLADRRLVWDNDKHAADLAGVVAPRWHATEGAEHWTADNAKQPRSFTHNGTGRTDWIRYRHLNLQWKTAPATLEDPVPPTDAETLKQQKPSFVDNFLAYNASRPTGSAENLWVGDLFLECEAEIAKGSEVTLELSRGVSRFQATFGNGQVTLRRIGPRGTEFGTPSRPCKVNEGTYKIRFANVDARLWVWVDDKRIDFGKDADYNPVETTDYDAEDVAKQGWTRANDIDAPASIGASGPVPGIRNIQIKRDIYYTTTKENHGDSSARPDIYYVQPGHYMCMGDNSAHSSDSREWGAVPQRLMLGKAVFVFWPAYPPPNRVGFIK